MALNPTLRLMVANAKAKYGEDLQAVAGAREETELKAALRLSVIEHLTVLGLRKASKEDMRRIILDALAREVAA
jgi:hypothetical protein